MPYAIYVYNPRFKNKLSYREVRSTKSEARTRADSLRKDIEASRSKQFVRVRKIKTLRSQSHRGKRKSVFSD